MLELRPTCEHCDRPLPPASLEAVICSFECTFCTSCVDAFIGNVCPNCGGNLCARPIRPKADRKGGNYLGRYSCSGKRKFRPKDVESHLAFRKQMEAIPLEDR